MEEKTLFGISLDALSLFSCPECNNEFTLSAKSVKDNQIIQGNLNCNCGKSLMIKEGIIMNKEWLENFLLLGLRIDSK